VVKEVYAALARRLAETRQQRGDRSTATYGEAAFRRDLDRARWTLKFALRL